MFVFYGESIYAQGSFTFNSFDDAVDAIPGDGLCATEEDVCTLRAAIQEANSLAGSDIVVLPSGTYALTLAGRLEDVAATGDLDITDDLTLTGLDPIHMNTKPATLLGDNIEKW